MSSNSACPSRVAPTRCGKPSNRVRVITKTILVRAIQTRINTGRAATRRALAVATGDLVMTIGKAGPMGMATVGAQARSTVPGMR